MTPIAGGTREMGWLAPPWALPVKAPFEVTVPVDKDPGWNAIKEVVLPPPFRTDTDTGVPTATLVGTDVETMDPDGV